MQEPSSHRLARLRFRAWHRGTREADYIFGGFFDRHHAGWDDAQIGWFEALCDEDDADVLAWALGGLAVPDRYAGADMVRLQALDYVVIAR